jgi:hypothetical protein
MWATLVKDLRWQQAETWGKGQEHLDVGTLLGGHGGMTGAGAERGRTYLVTVYLKSPDMVALRVTNGWGTVVIGLLADLHPPRLRGNRKIANIDRQEGPDYLADDILTYRKADSFRSPQTLTKVSQSGLEFWS